jgi:putative zinc finger protein
MKPFSKTKDGVTDSLLRAYVSRPGNPSQACSEFDPDLANAYIERRLPSGSRSRYEHHLSECGACRKNVVALVRLADTSASVSPARDRDHATWLSGARKLFGAMSRPQWAMATAAVLVLVISLPVLLSRDSGRPNQKAADSISAEQGQAAANPEAANQSAVGTPALSSRSRGADSPTSATTALKKREGETEATSTPGDVRSAGAPSVVAGVVDQTQKSDTKSASPTADEGQRKSQSESASQAPGQAGAASSQVAKNLSEEAHKQRQEKDSAQQAQESKPGRVDEPRDREKTAKAEQVAPPPPAVPSEVARSNRGLKRSAPKLALTDSSGSGESVRANAKRIIKKDFFFRDNTWTDKDFDPNKDLPVVTIIRDSNVYKELLAKRANLRPYLEAFSPNERAIIVYKGTVYKLIPQK